MKKFTLLFIALLSTIGVWATVTTSIVQGSQVTSAEGIVDGGKYVIRVNGGSYITEANSQYEAPNAQNSVTENAVFTFHANGNAWNVECEATGNYWGTLPGAAAGNFKPTEAASAGSWTFTFNGNNISLTSGGYYINRSSGVMHGWSSTISLQIYNIEEVNLVGAMSDLSNNKAYYVTTADRGAWFVVNGGTAVTSTTKAGFAPSMSDTKQQFAFLTYGNTGIYHLYSISEKKFVSKSGDYTTLTSELGNNVTLLTGTGDANYPFVVALNDGANQMGISNGYNPAVITFWNSLTDGGNKVQIREVADFDPTEPMAILEAAYSTTVTVTYEVYDGETFIESHNAVQDKNSEVNVPEVLKKNAWFYDYTPSGTIGETDCTITVARTYKAGVAPVLLSDLNNYKAYTLTTERGSLGSNGTQMVSTYTTSYTASNFAIINYENNYYLYSVADSKFVGNPVTIGGVANQPALTNDLSQVSPLTFALTTAPLYFMGMGSNGVNVSNYATGIVVNSWTTRDAGNQYIIEEAADFDPTAALAALQNYFHPTANMRITDAGWATFWAPFAVEIPAGVKAYTGEMKQGWIRMNEQTKGYIPANTGVVLELVEGEPFETELSPMSPQPNEAAVESCYTGNESGAIMDVAVGNYLLQIQNDVVGWYKVEGEGFKLAPNRCYLSKDDVPAPNQSRTFFGFAPADDATGISSIATEAKTKADGKYMVKGQIVVVKAGKAYYMSGAEIK